MKRAQRHTFCLLMRCADVLSTMTMVWSVWVRADWYAFEHSGKYPPSQGRVVQGATPEISLCPDLREKSKKTHVCKKTSQEEKSWHTMYTKAQNIQEGN